MAELVALGEPSRVVVEEEIHLVQQARARLLPNHHKYNIMDY
jgi:hypothetical protein